MVLIYKYKKRKTLQKVGAGLIMGGSTILLFGVGGGIISSPLNSYTVSGPIVYTSATVGTLLTVSGIVTICLGTFSKIQ